MKRFLNLGTYLFHPIGTALLGSLIYFWVTPRFFPVPVMEAKLLAILMLCVFVPLIFAMMLKKANIIKSLTLKTRKERQLLLLFYAVLLLTVNNFILGGKFVELYYFFEGLLLTAATSFFFTFSSTKISLHTAGISTLMVFVIGISILYNVNLIRLIALLIFVLGWVITEQLTQKGTSLKPIIMGLLLGSLPQILFFVVSYYRYKI